MIDSVFGLAAVLILTQGIILFFAQHEATKKFFDIIPSVFWIYFIPMLLSTFGIIKAQSPLYGWVTTYILPASLFLLLLGVDIRAILKMGTKSIMLFFIGAFGMMVGAVISFSIFKGSVGQDFWMGFGALCGSWTGGSANMVAVKEALSTPENIFAPMVIVDTIVPYLWMALLITASNWQQPINRMIRADQKLVSEMENRLGNIQQVTVLWRFFPVVGILLFAAVISMSVNYGATWLPVVKGILTTFTWIIILVSMVGLVLSLSPLRQLEKNGSTKIGYVLLYFVLTTIGAKASISNFNTAFLLITAGMVMVSIHAIILLIGGWLIRAPLALIASASQANIGGVASAPVVAEIYQPGLASVGLLMAILGNIVGTYLGIFAAHVCRLVGG